MKHTLFISRADVAHCMLRVLEQPEATSKSSASLTSKEQRSGGLPGVTGGVLGGQHADPL
jgi:hypothetical protein